MALIKIITELAKAENSTHTDWKWSTRCFAHNNEHSCL